MSGAFARAKAMFGLISAAMALGGIAARESALRKVGSYRSRGKGRGTPSRRFGNDCTDWTGRRTGHREAARRRSQMQRGLLREHPRTVQLAQHRKAA